MRKVAFYTLGCKLNFSETSTISRGFEEKGYMKVGFSDTPDIFIINTCSVTENADKKCKKIVREAQKINPEGYVAIIGCYAQLKPKEISEIPGVDAVLGAAEKFRLIELLDDFVKTPQAKVLASEIKEANTFNNAYSLNDRTRTFLKVQDGCNYHCTFCTIPLARGKSRSDSIENIVKSAREIAAADVKEIVLTGVNIGDFGIQDGKRQERFIDLVKALDEVEGINRIRISSIEPNLLNNEVIEFCLTIEAVLFPIFIFRFNQEVIRFSANMRRRYLRELYEDRVNKIKQLIPPLLRWGGCDCWIFQGKQMRIFLDTHNFLNNLDISYLHVFTYSERANTAAPDMENPVPLKVRQNRSKMLRILSEKKKRAFYENNIGKTGTVLFEDDVENGMMHGFTENYVRVAAKYDPMLVNELKTLKLESIADNGIALAEETCLVREL